MKPTPMLDFWQKPPSAGEPVAVIATTFAFDSDFFEQSCLARFLEVSSVDEGSGSVEDVVAAVELHELLRNARVTVLADKSAPVQRTSLNWDLLSCHIDSGLLHAKVAVLVWENAARVIMGSANLTEAGYRRQIELGLAADLGPGCLLPQQALLAIADEIESYLRLVPGYAGEIAVFARAMSTLQLFRQRAAEQPSTASSVRVAFAPTNAAHGPLDRIGDVWSGSQPMRATHLSPFWDANDCTALESVRKLLTGRPAANRSHDVGVVLGSRGQTSFSHHLEQAVNSVRQLKPLDAETRILHAKCLLVASDQWVAALIGSSNHTKAGLGLGPKSRRHREMNLWIGASSRSAEGKALLALIQLGPRVAADAEEVEPSDEDEESLPWLPASFGLCRVGKRSDGAWELHLGIEKSRDMPLGWIVQLDDGRDILSRQEWEAAGQPQTVTVAVSTGALPMYLNVHWADAKVPWAVVADDPHGLPPGPVLSSLRAQHLLGALAKGQSLSQAVRAMLDEKKAKEKGSGGGVVVDPLKRLEVRDSLLRRGRALAASLSAMQRRLDPQVITADALRARLAGPLGPEFVALKVAQAFEEGQQDRAEAMFTIAEIALSVGRVNWLRVTEHIDRVQGLALVARTIDCLDELRTRVGNEPRDLASYASRAIQEARRCVMV